MSDKTIFFIGNGGSAATSSHLAADLGKNTVENILNINEKRFRTISLSDNISWITAVANDLSYEDVFVEQLKNLAGEGDVLFIVSGSGNSKNIVKAASWAKTNKLSVVGLLGFDGGEVKKYTGEGLVVESDNYGIIESVHSYIHHYIVEALKPMKERNL
jgi:D-sedoheptulose 7-phosphate isomerase